MTIEMTDQELLEYAAKAVGFEYASGYWLSIINDRFPNEKGSLYVRKAHDEYVEWNPLASDADAFRLAARLVLSVYPPEDDDPTAVAEDWNWGVRITEVDENGDYLSTTRRAIVRAAAELGKQMMAEEETLDSR